MKITGLTTRCIPVNHRGNWLFVFVQTDGGIGGAGEASHSGNDALTAAWIDHLGPRLNGRNPAEMGSIIRELRRLASRREHFTAASGIEHALWDIAGKAAQKPVYELLGHPIRNAVKLYANINRCTVDRRPEGFAANAARAIGEGFQAIKLAPFDEVSYKKQGPKENGQAAKPGIARVCKVCDVVRGAAEVFVDCHNRFHPAAAAEVVRQLHDLGITWFEQPIRETQPDEVARLQSISPVRIAGGEGARDKTEYQPLFSRHALDIAMPDVKHIGGIQELLKASQLAAEASILTAPHCPSGPVSLAASAHAMAVDENFLILEYAYGETDWRKDLCCPPEPIEKGHLLLSSSPGLGVCLGPP